MEPWWIIMYNCNHGALSLLDMWNMSYDIKHGVKQIIIPSAQGS